MVSSRVMYSVALFVLVMSLVVVTRPSLVFDERGVPKPFGVGDGGTMFPLGVVTVFVAVLSTYALAFAELASPSRPPQPRRLFG